MDQKRKMAGSELFISGANLSNEYDTPSAEENSLEYYSKMLSTFTTGKDCAHS